MLVLTFTTGVNDAVGYLGLNKVFTGNMTGNVVVLGMALAGRDGLPVLGPALALAGFMVGAGFGGRTLRRAPSGWGVRTTVVFGVVAGLLVGLSVLLWVVGDHPSPVVEVITTTVAAVAMGSQAAAARHLAVRDVTTVVVTSTLTGLAADSPLGSGKALWRSDTTYRRALVVVLLLLGALAGAGLLRWHLCTGLLAAGVLVGCAAWGGALWCDGRAGGVRSTADVSSGSDS